MPMQVKGLGPDREQIFRPPYERLAENIQFWRSPVGICFRKLKEGVVFMVELLV